MSPTDPNDRWFVRHGMPHAIADYSIREDVWTRAWPFLLFVMFVELFSTFGDRFAGWAQALVFVVGLGMLVGAFVLINVARGRKWSRRPDRIGTPELSVFVIVPPLSTLLLSDRGWSGALFQLGAGVAVLGVAFLVTSYGVVPASRVGLLQSTRQLRTVTHLVARRLPLLLLITTFVFLNAEMWQVAHDFPPIYFAICVAVLVGLAFAFLALRVPEEIGELARFETWEECAALVRTTDAPIVGHLPELSGTPPEPDIGRLELINVGMLLTISQAVQTLLIGLTAGAFYVLFGMLAVREETIMQWTTAERFDAIVTFSFLGDRLALTWEHLAVAGFVSAFSVLQFAVASVTDTAYREAFDDDVAHDVRRVLAVRAMVRAAQ